MAMPESSGPRPCIHVFIGTKAQYIKTAPLLRLMDQRGTEYRLIDSGQHAQLSVGLREELGVRAPNVVLGSPKDVNTIPGAVGWAFGLARRLISRKRLVRDVFGDRSGVCVIHGDTPSTLLAAVMAKRAGMRIAHLEAGLTSGSWKHPFPEEIIRFLTHRVSDILFAASSAASNHLGRLRIKGQVVTLGANTGVESLRRAIPNRPPGGGPAILTCHRVENLHLNKRLRAFVDIVVQVSEAHPVRLVLHGPTERVLKKSGELRRIRELDSRIEVLSLVPHAEFVAMLWESPFVITDGGSIQEECAVLGVPTLLWRDRTERPDGLGRNVSLSRYDPKVIAEFLADPERLRVPIQMTEDQPSQLVLAALLRDLSGGVDQL